MKLQVTQENLAKALNTVARVANSRNTLPILSNILIKTVGTRLSISATNLDIAITQFIGSKVIEEGVLTVPARLMQDFVTSLPSGVISISTQDNKLTIKTDGYNSTINGAPADDFPVMPSIKNGKSWFMPAKTLKKTLQQVVGAASSDETRPTLTGIYFHTKSAKLIAVATDSYRLAEKSVMKTTEDIDLLVPASAMQDLLKILGDSEGDVEVTTDNQQVLFRVSDVELVARLIDGKYPDYVKLIPQKFETSATVGREDFINITKVSSLFARESAGSITLHTSVKDKKLTIHSVASQVGENNAAADAEVSNDGEITLNSRYLLDALQTVDADQVIIGFNGKLEPCVIGGDGDNEYKHIIMPLKS